MAYEVVPSGTNLTTYYPDRPGLGDNWKGFLIESPGDRSTKRLIVIGADDAQEQAASRVVAGIVRQLLSGSTLARRLLRTFSFIIIPFTAQQAVYDGYSRFGNDCAMPLLNEGSNGALNGISQIGGLILQAAIRRWCSTLPIEKQPEALFCVVSMHCSNPPNDDHNILSRATNQYPTTPYAKLAFPDYEGIPTNDVEAFISGFNTVVYKEFFNANPASQPATPSMTLGGYGEVPAGWGGSSFYFEFPWRSPGHKASYWWDDDTHENQAIAILEGLAVAAAVAVTLTADYITTDLSTVTGLNTTSAITRRTTLMSTSVTTGLSIATNYTKRLQYSFSAQSGIIAAASISRVSAFSGATIAGASIANTLAKDIRYNSPLISIGASVTNNIVHRTLFHTSAILGTTVTNNITHISYYATSTVTGIYCDSTITTTITPHIELNTATVSGLNISTNLSVQGLPYVVVLNTGTINIRVSASNSALIRRAQFATPNLLGFAITSEIIALINSVYFWATIEEEDGTRRSAPSAVLTISHND